jgi:hypothetical protein
VAVHAKDSLGHAVSQWCKPSPASRCPKPVLLCCCLQTELLDPEMNALEYMMKEYKDIPLEKMRSVVSSVIWCDLGLFMLALGPSRSAFIRQWHWQTQADTCLVQHIEQCRQTHTQCSSTPPSICVSHPESCVSLEQRGGQLRRSWVAYSMAAMDPTLLLWLLSWCACCRWGVLASQALPRR